MSQRIAVGGEDFAALRKADSYYVDKTEILYELFQETNNPVTLFTRPRRFGKTLTLSMMEHFFDVERKEERGIFDGLSIMSHPAFCEEYMNQYPVVFLSLKDVEGRSFDLAYDKLKNIISEQCIRCSALESNDKISLIDRETFHRLLFKTAGEGEIQNSLKTITRMLNAVYGKPVILLIDEYDVPLAKAHANGYYREMLDVIRGLMSTSLKTNEYLKFAVVTGCLRIPKESIFTGVNNFTCYSVLDDDFSQYFGFTSDEVDQMLAAFHLSDRKQIIREWYDGYAFGETRVYCPWDVTSYIRDVMRKPNAKPRNYWENTSGNAEISKFFDLSDTDITNDFETLLSGGTICKEVTNSLTYDHVYETEKGLWSLLLMTGYVTPVMEEEQTETDGIYLDGVDAADEQITLRIPNREISGIFQKAVVSHFNRSVKNNPHVAELMGALWNGDDLTATQILSDLLWNTISYMDYGEDYYHAFLAGIFVGSGKYIVESNKEQGLGRPDICVLDRKKRRAMIIEAKISESRRRMAHWCDEAIDQIAENGYAKGLEEDYSEILCYGISFYKKNALVKKQR